jgi:putative ABC transport system permease protein
VGRLLLIWRLARGDIKRRRAQSALLVVMIATTTTTLALGLALHGVSTDPFARTRAATRGPDVVAVLGGVPETPFSPSAGSLGRFETLSRAPGVHQASGPYKLAFPRLAARGRSVVVAAEGRGQAPSAIDQPLLTAGHWVRPGGAVVERGLADALGVHVGERIQLERHPFRIVGTAETTATAFYPAASPGMVWLTRGDVEQLTAIGRPGGDVLYLKLVEPAAAPAFTAEHAVNPAWSLQSWQDIRSRDLTLITVEQRVLLAASALLAVFAIATIAVLVGGGMSDQTRRVGLLKAVGGTPRLIGVMLLVENLLLALVAAIVGLGAGRVLAPTLIHAGSGLLGSPSPSPPTITSSALVVLVAVGVALAATIAPTVRGARTSTIDALNDAAHAPRRRPWLIALSTRLPVPLLFGMRLLARRSRRAALTAASLTIATTMIVATLTVQHNLDTRNANLASHVGRLPGTFTVDRVSRLVFLICAILIVLAMLTTITTTWATVIDAERATALARALGATPGQIGAGLATAQLLPAALAACLGIPLGLGLYATVSQNGDPSPPPILWLLAVVPAVLFVVGALTAIPARIGARRPFAEVLRSE